MRGLSIYLAAGILVVLAIDFIAPPVGLGINALAWPASPRAALVQHVDRTHKGDRLPVPTAADKPSTPIRARPPLIGCDPAFSSLAAVKRPSFPARCIAEMPAARRVAGR